MDLRSFRDSRVLVVGDVMLDRYWWGSVGRISPEAPVPVVKLERETTKPGGAANVAANAAALGAKVGLIGLVGDDAESGLLRKGIELAGVDFRDLLPSARRRTTVKTRVVAHNQQVVRLDSEDTDELDPAEGQAILDAIGARLDGVALVILSDYGKGLLTASLVNEIVSVCKAARLPLLADPKGKHFEKYSGATVLTPNRREAAEACKIEDFDPDLVLKAGERLLKDHEFDNVLITESENGMTLFRKDREPRHFDASAQEVFDVTGAGDTVIGCLGVAMAAGFDMEEAVRLANIAAGLSVRHVGTVAISSDELEQELRRLAGAGSGLATA